MSRKENDLYRMQKITLDQKVLYHRTQLRHFMTDYQDSNAIKLFSVVNL
jgi:hypothetical protein